MIVKLLTKHHLEEHSDQGLSVCIFLNIFLTGRSHIIKLWNNNQISGHFLVAFLDASNVAHFSCRFARKNGPQRRIPPPPPELFHIGIVCLLLWQIPSPQRSLGHSLFKQKFSKKFLCFFVLFCICFFVLFLFFILSKFPNSHSLV